MPSTPTRRDWPDDPRDHLDPAYRPFISDAAVEAWRTDSLCLCGCGEPTKLRNGKYKGVPTRVPFFFKVYHQWRLTDVRRGRNNSPEHCRNISKGLKNTTIVTAGLAFIIEDYLASHPGFTLKELAKRAGMGRTHLSEIKTGRCKRVRKTTAVRILEACEEKVRRELRRAS